MNKGYFISFTIKGGCYVPGKNGAVARELFLSEMRDNITSFNPSQSMTTKVLSTELKNEEATVDSIEEISIEGDDFDIFNPHMED